jgi:two-component system phosphate regulon sensor histidine kinase PhoR
MFLFNPKSPTPRILAFLAAFYSFLFSSIILLIIKLIIPHSITWWFLGLTSFVQLIVTYIVFSDALRRFIYNKIKVIYKSIHSLKAPKSSTPLIIDLDTHIIEKVESEVTEWAKDWTKEIKYLKKMEQFRREFIDNVSHELKTPIFNIQGYLYTLSDGGIEDDLIREKYLNRAIDNVERMAEIVHDLNQISKFESGGILLNAVKFNIIELVNEVMEDMEMSASRKKIELALKENTTKKSYQVMADKDMIRQVITNLLSNSIKYGREGGSTLIGFYDLDKNILIEVSDTGKGISQEHLPRLFERFYRVDKGRSRDEGGTGLGLSIVKHIIEAHNQTINVRSRLGVGSTFGFTLEKSK